MAFLPQFIDPLENRITGQILFLGSLFVAIGICTNSIYVLLASTVSGWLKGNDSFLKGQRFISGAIYIILGVITALSGLEINW